jgi:hypothetical protein
MSSRTVWTTEALERTEWAVGFKKDAPVSYAAALRYAQEQPLKVLVERTDETGEPQWVVRVLDDPSFWMYAKPTKTAAVELCRAMGWKIAA